MSDLLKIGRNAAMTTNEAVAEQISPEENTPVENEADFIADGATDSVSEGETVMDLTEDLEGEGFADDTGADEGETFIEPGMEEEYIDDGAFIDSGVIDGGYIDPGFYEGEYMEPGMEMGMSEVKDPLLSSWPFVIGISAAVFLVSVALGALLAKLKIKKGIDLYED